MVIVDRALEARAAEGRPIRVAIVGAGFMGRAVARQIIRRVPGIRVTSIVNRHVDRAVEVWRDAGVDDVATVSDRAEFDRQVAAGRPVATDDPDLACASDSTDVVLESTGDVEYGANVVSRALEHGRHVVLNNAELDGTAGPILQDLARGQGRVLTAIDGDQPGVELNLLRFVASLGIEALVAGNVKGLQDPYRTPETQAGFAQRWGQEVHKVTGFADGTKISFEQAIVANATGFRVARRGMGGGEFRRHVDELVDHYDLDELKAWGGIVDYVVGASPAPGVYVIAVEEDVREREYLRLYKMGEGPLYVFYVPYHLCHFEVPLTIARAALFGDAAVAARGAPVVEVVATAKRDLRAGEELDGIGGFTVYGQCENADAVARERLLPMGVAEGGRVTRDIARDEVLGYGDVSLPTGRLIDELRTRQATMFPPTLQPSRSLDA